MGEDRMKGGEKMTDVVWAALLSLLGSLAGTFAGILTSAKLTDYRLSQLEKKMEGISQLMYQLEQKTAVHEERLRVGSIGRSHDIQRIN